MTTNPRHIIVTGAMGVGKTTVGRLLARRLDVPFLDSDVVIEGETGRTAAEIASKEGIAHLHDLELTVFLEMSKGSLSSVIAPAASVVDHPSGRRALDENFTVWLRAPDEVLAQREASGDHRREVDAGTRATLRAERSPALADVSSLILDTSITPPGELVARIIERLPDSLDHGAMNDS